MIAANRRAFLRTLLSLPIAATIDVEQLLWTPSPIITVPAMPMDFAAPVRELLRRDMEAGLASMRRELARAIYTPRYTAYVTAQGWN